MNTQLIFNSLTVILMAILLWRVTKIDYRVYRLTREWRRLVNTRWLEMDEEQIVEDILEKAGNQ